MLLTIRSCYILFPAKRLQLGELSRRSSLIYRFPILTEIRSLLKSRKISKVSLNDPSGSKFRKLHCNSSSKTSNYNGHGIKIVFLEIWKPPFVFRERTRNYRECGCFWQPASPFASRNSSRTVDQVSSCAVTNVAARWKWIGRTDPFPDAFHFAKCVLRNTIPYMKFKTIVCTDILVLSMYENWILEPPENWHSANRWSWESIWCFLFYLLVINLEFKSDWLSWWTIYNRRKYVVHLMMEI